MSVEGGTEADPILKWTGDLVWEEITNLFDELRARSSWPAKLTIDLTGAGETDISGLQLLYEFSTFLRARGVAATLRLPSSWKDTLRFSGLHFEEVGGVTHE